jgi:hypothetical protein
MKPLFHIGIFLAGALTTTTSVAQSYTPFYIDSSTWIMYEVHPVIGPEDGHSYWMNYTLEDTLISDTTYAILARRNLCSLFPDQNGTLHHIENLNTSEMRFGGIREANKKVYVRYFDTGEEILLYDFDVEAGDTVYFTPDIFTIIRSVNPPSNGLVNYTVSNSTAWAYPHETGFLYEGFGSSYGLFGSYDSYLTDLLCFERHLPSDSLIGACTPCAQYISVSAEVAEDNAGAIQVYPNPATSHLILESVTPMVMITALDMTGKVCATYAADSRRVVLDITGIPSSLLILRIQLEDERQIVKRVMKYW